MPYFSGILSVLYPSIIIITRVLIYLHFLIQVLVSREPLLCYVGCWHFHCKVLQKTPSIFVWFLWINYYLSFIFFCISIQAFQLLSLLLEDYLLFSYWIYIFNIFTDVAILFLVPSNNILKFFVMFLPKIFVFFLVWASLFFAFSV